MGVTGNTIVCGALLGTVSLISPIAPASAQTTEARPSAMPQLPAFLDNRRLDNLEAAREAAEEGARRRAAKRQRRNEEAEARRAAETEAMRKAEEIRRLTDEADARRRREEEGKSGSGTAEARAGAPASRVGPSWYGGDNVFTPGTATAAGFVVPSPSSPCPAAGISTSALPLGRMSIAIDSPCRAGRELQIVYGRFAFSRTLDFEGRGNFVLDLFQGTSEPIAVAFSNEERRSLQPQAKDLDKVSKVAVVWQAPVNLDLHAYEYAATAAEPGHIWAKAASSLEATVQQVAQRRRGAGFLSTADDGRKEGAKVEVYTFLHHEEQTSGAVTLALDYESRGSIPASESCGNGRNAEVALEVVMLERTGRVQHEAALIPAASCGEALPDRVRYNNTAVPTLRWRR